MSHLAEEVTHSTPGGAARLVPTSPNYLILRDGLRYAYHDEGQGEPVVMVHGNPTWSFYYRNLRAGLSDRYRVIVPDHIGCGQSDKPGDDRYDYTLESRARDLEMLLDNLGVRNNVTLVLHDWGGMIGMTWASWHPERLKRLVLLNTGGFLLPPGKKLPWQIGVVRNTPLGPFLVRGLNLFSRGAVRSCAMKPLSEQARQGYLAPYDSWANRIAVLRFVQDIPLKPGDRSYDLVRSVMDGLDRFRAVPKLICWGEKDFVFDEHFLAEWIRRFPEAEVHRYPDAGHFVLEDAGQDVLNRVRDFLSRHPIGS